LVFYNLQSNI